MLTWPIASAGVPLFVEPTIVSARIAYWLGPSVGIALGIGAGETKGVGEPGGTVGRGEGVGSGGGVIAGGGTGATSVPDPAGAIGGIRNGPSVGVALGEGDAEGALPAEAVGEGSGTGFAGAVLCATCEALERPFSAWRRWSVVSVPGPQAMLRAWRAAMEGGTSDASDAGVSKLKTRTNARMPAIGRRERRPRNTLQCSSRTIK